TEIASLKSLELLSLSNNAITEIDETLRSLPKLQRLNLNNNQIREVPDWLFEKPDLKALELNNNRITKLRHLYHYSRELEILRLAGNEILIWPRTLAKMQKLVELDMDFCPGIQLRKVRSLLYRFPKLRRLRVPKNHFGQHVLPWFNRYRRAVCI
ncbi:MAG: leucine-rich repeat domain-containing protein, partial [Bacteroidota bacterium]